MKAILNVHMPSEGLGALGLDSRDVDLGESRHLSACILWVCTEVRIVYYSFYGVLERYQMTQASWSSRVVYHGH